MFTKGPRAATITLHARDIITNLESCPRETESFIDAEQPLHHQLIVNINAAEYFKFSSAKMLVLGTALGTLPSECTALCSATTDVVISDESIAALRALTLNGVRELASRFIELDSVPEKGEVLEYLPHANLKKLREFFRHEIALQEGTFPIYGPLRGALIDECTSNLKDVHVSWIKNGNFVFHQKDGLVLPQKGPTIRFTRHGWNEVSCFEDEHGRERTHTTRHVVLDRGDEGDY